MAMSGGMAHLTKGISETNIVSLEGGPRAQLWKLFQITHHMCQTRKLGERQKLKYRAEMTVRPRN